MIFRNPEGIVEDFKHPLELARIPGVHVNSKGRNASKDSYLRVPMSLRIPILRIPYYRASGIPTV